MIRSALKFKLTQFQREYIAFMGSRPALFDMDMLERGVVEFVALSDSRPQDFGMREEPGLLIVHFSSFDRFAIWETGRQ